MLSILVILTVLGFASSQSNTEVNARTKLIWDSDENRLCDSDVLFDAEGPQLFTYVNEDALTTPTWVLFKQLLTSYNIYEGEVDACYSNQTCVDSEYAFVDALLATAPIELCRQFIAQYDSSLADPVAFREWLWSIWFHPYSRHAPVGQYDSSGFQHVFQGELKIEGDNIGGFHNWYQLYTQEQSGNFVFGSKTGLCDPDVPRFDLTWYGYPKSIDSVWVRTTPEVEIAIYTLLFKFRPDQAYTCNVDNYDVPIQTWQEETADGTFVGSAYVRC